ncbi:MAG: aminotransferase class V-fold PLP-dependent enzyme [Lachnospiraceae bacterium]|nr:aminotransferase class V-fold PLP-dependent enzyme [Lachnospiraceae bacterium]
MVYLDNAATTIYKPPAVAKAVCEAIETMGNAGRGVNEASLKSLRMLSETRKLLSELFNFPDQNRVCFCSNATEALNTAIMGLFSKGDHVVTTAMEHNSVLRPLYLLSDTGMIELTVLRVDKVGRISFREMEESFKENTKAVIMGHASNLTGNVVDLKRVGEICRKKNVMLVVDAAQTAGAIPIDMVDMNISVLCFTGHKALMGPQGTGGIIVSEGVDIRPLKSGGTGMHSYDRTQPEIYPEHLEAGTLNIHGIAGLNAALKYIVSMGLDVLNDKEAEFTKEFVQGVQNIPGVEMIGDYSDLEPTCHTGIVSLNIGDYDSSEVCDELSVRFDIATRGGAHCAPMAHESLGTKNRGAVRFSFSHSNTKDEIIYAINAVKTLATE